MLRVFYLFWTLIAALLVTGLGYFYLREVGRHGFPFAFATEIENSLEGGNLALSLNGCALVLDIMFWWLLFSILLIVFKNYVFESD